MKSRLLAIAAILSTVIATAPAPAQVEPPPTLAELEGEWIATYWDSDIGGVEGLARIDAAGTAEVVYDDPASGRSVRLQSTSLRLDGGRLVIEFSGQPATTGAKDGTTAPDVAYVIGQPAEEFTVRWGENSATMALKPLAETDRNRITVEFAVDDARLSGHWRYRSHPFIGRAADGHGRDGQVEEDEAGVTWTTGLESWRRPQPVVYGVIPLEDQLALEFFSDGTSAPHYGYPFGPKRTVTGRTRTLFVFGKDLPRDHGRRIAIEAVDGGIAYEELARRSDADRAEIYAALFAEGWKKLEERLPADADGSAVLDGLDAIIVRARLSKAAVPGLNTFRVDGQEVAWLLQFGDNLAQLRIVRPIGRTGQAFEQTGFVFPGEFVRIEVETTHQLPADSIPVLVGVDGAPLLLGDGKGIPAGRDPDNPRIYQTDYIYLDPGLSAGQAVDYRAGLGFHAVPVRQGSRLTALLGEQGLISIPPTIGQATVFETPGDTGVGGNWETWLEASAACADAPEAGVPIDRAHAATIAEYLLSETFTRSVGLETRISVGQHAAMLLLRDTFVRLLERNRAQFGRLGTDEEMLAFRRHLEPLVRQGGTPLAKIKVASLDGVGETEFIWTFEKSILAKLHDRRIDEVEAWAIAATRQALERYRAAMADAIARAQDIETCDVEELLKLTGSGFEPVARIAKSKLMMQQAGVWAPAHRPRAWVDTVALLGDQLDIQERVGDEDTEMVVMSVGLASIPVAVVGGAYGYMGAVIATFVIDIFDVAYGTYKELDQKWAQDREVQFATGAADVLGIARLEEAEARQLSWSQVFVRLGFIVGPAATGMIFDVPDLFKGFEAALHLRKADRGRQAIMSLNAIPPARAGAAPALEAGRAIEAAIDQAAQDAASLPFAASPARRQLAELVQETPATARTVDAPPAAAGGAADGSRPLRINFDDLPDVAENVAEDIAAHLDTIGTASRRSQLDAGTLLGASELDDFAGFSVTPPWERHFRPDDLAELNRHWELRADIRRLMDDAPERLAALLNEGGQRSRRAWEVLRSEPGLDIAQFERRVDSLVRRFEGPHPVHGADYYRQAAPDNGDVTRSLREEGWRAKRSNTNRGELVQLGLDIRDPSGRIGGVRRGYDPDTGTFDMWYAFADLGRMHAAQPGRIDSMIRGGALPFPLGQSGTPAIQFFNMRIMNALGIPYGSANGIRIAKMNHIVNARTVTQLGWFKATYYPTVAWKDIPGDELSAFLQLTHSGRYGAESLGVAGYRVKRAKLVFNKTAKENLGEYRRYFEDGRRPNEPPPLPEDTFDAFMSRHELSSNSPVDGWFDIVFDVEPW